MSTILITHDLGLAAAYCDRVVVMEKGHVVETAAVGGDLRRAVARLYASKLMRATPAARRVAAPICCRKAKLQPAASRRAAEAERRGQAPAGQPRAVAGGRKAGQGISRARYRRVADQAHAAQRGGEHPRLRRPFRAVDGISFTVHRGESVGLVGESGCGKSTTSTMVMRLIDASPVAASMFDGQDIGAIPAKKFARCRCASASRWCSRTRPTASIRASPRRAPSPIRSCACGDVTRRQGRARALRGAGAAGRAAGGAARPLSASAVRRAEGARRHRARHRAQSRSGHLSTSRRRRSTSRCRRWCSTCLQDLEGAAGHELPVRVARPQRCATCCATASSSCRRGRSSSKGRPSGCCSAPQAAYTRDLLTAIPHPPL